MSLLQISSLRAGYGDFQALFDIDLHARRGETIAIIGANGAGKSTLLKAISGVVPVERGAISFDGTPICRMSPQDIVTRGIAMVPEGRRLFPSLTVLENLQMGTYAGRQGDWTVERVLDLFPRLRERVSQKPSLMSGGEQQMVAIGRALLCNPVLLMCDELSLGLAPAVVKDIYKHLRKVKESGATVIIVEQDVRQALAVADRVYCLQEGHVSLTGRPSELTLDAISAAYFGSERRTA